MSEMVVLDDAMEYTPQKRLREVWTTHAGPVELAMPHPGFLSAGEVDDLCGWLSALARKVRRLREEGAGPLVKRLSPKQETKLKAELLKNLEQAGADDRTATPEGQPVRPGWYRKAGDQVEDRYVLGVAPGSPAGTPTRIDYRTRRGEERSEPLGDFLTWIDETEFLGRTPAPPDSPQPADVIRLGLYAKPNGERRMVRRLIEDGWVSWVDGWDEPLRSCSLHEFTKWAADAAWVGSDVTCPEVAE